MSWLDPILGRKVRVGTYVQAFGATVGNTEAISRLVPAKSLQTHWSFKGNWIGQILWPVSVPKLKFWLKNKIAGQN